MNWPPNPDKKPDLNKTETHEIDRHTLDDKSWQVIEKTMLASVQEQRRSRRWNVFFKFLGFAYLFFFLVIAGGRSCSSSSSDGGSGLTMIDEPHIAVVDVKGIISSENDANADDINKAINEAYDNKNVKAVALRINSGGGSPVQSDRIWQNIMAKRKKHKNIKTYAIIEDMGASGAYYIASATDEIYVNPTSLVGSIGVILPNYDIQGTMKKAGVKDRTLHAGEYKDILSMGREMTEFEKEHINKLLASTHNTFIKAVKEGRGKKLKDPEKNKLFTGLFWTGEQSIKLGLADKQGDLAQLKKDLKLDTAYNYTPEDPMKKLFEQFSMSMGEGFGSALSEKLINSQQGTELR